MLGRRLTQKGWSGSEIVVQEDRVIKSGDGASRQGRYCEHLGQLVCPRVISYVPNGYVMERLVEPDEITDEWGKDTLTTVRQILEAEVWDVSSSAVQQQTSWRLMLRDWLQRMLPDSEEQLDKLYPEEHKDVLGFVHGDPTLANCLLRPGDLEIVICDPIRSTGKIPSIPEIDVAKMLQSVVGWEHIACGWPLLSLWGAVQPVTYGFEHRRLQFWLMVHLLRIVPYVGSDPIVKKWADDGARSIMIDMESHESLDTTLQTLHQLSKRLGS